MLNNSLPKYFDPRECAGKKSAFEGCIPLSQFKGLCSFLASDKGNASIHLKFRVDRKCYTATGLINAQLQLVCQRCMVAAPHEITASLSVGFIHNENCAKNLPKEYDPVIMIDGIVILEDMIEEEIILSLPIVAYHKEDDCSPTVVGYALSNDTKMDDKRKSNPFNVLSQHKI